MTTIATIKTKMLTILVVRMKLEIRWTMRIIAMIDADDFVDNND